MFENETLDWNRNNCWRVFSTLSHFQFQHQPQMIKTESHDQSKVDRNTTGGCPNSAGCRHGNQGGRDPGRRAGKAGGKWGSTTGGRELPGRMTGGRSCAAWQASWSWRPGGPPRGGRGTASGWQEVAWGRAWGRPSAGVEMHERWMSGKKNANCGCVHEPPLGTAHRRGKIHQLNKQPDNPLLVLTPVGHQSPPL